MSENTEAGLISFSESDIKAGYLVQEPNWYDYKILTCRENLSKKGTSTNYFVSLRGESGEMNGVEFQIMLNTSEGFRGKIIRLFQAANGGNELTAGKPYNWKDVIGLTISGYTLRGLDQNGNSINDVSDFRPKQ